MDILNKTTIGKDKVEDAKLARTTNNPEIIEKLIEEYDCLECLQQFPIEEDLIKLGYKKDNSYVFIKDRINDYSIHVNLNINYWVAYVYYNHTVIGTLDIHTIQTLKDFEDFIREKL